MRKFIRHPIDIPIEYSIGGSVDSVPPHLQNISEGGLCITTHQAVAAGSIICIKIGIQHPPFEAEGTVMWCHKKDDCYETGVKFDDDSVEYMVRMVEQVCHIEQYKNDALLKEGRTLSSEQAAKEWVKQNAEDFPR